MIPQDLPATWQRAFAWIEQSLGGKVVRAQRQPRWRPAWFLDLERDGQLLPLYFRGARSDMENGVASLAHELNVLQILERHGIPVPHVHGFCPDPAGIVMERSPGRANLASAESEAERVSVLDHYMEILARIHGIEIAAFEAMGMVRPENAEQRGLCDFEKWEQGFRKRKKRPEPALEFLTRWVRRNVPRGRERTSFICCDSGQFLFERGRVTAVIDLELACLGDPAADLGGLPGRDLSEPLGYLTRAVRRYEQLSGESIDRGVIDFHTVRFSTTTPLALAHLVADPPPGVDLVQYLSWYLVWTRSSLEVIAARQGVELVDPLLPATGAALELAPSDDAFGGYEADRVARIALYQERRSRLGPELEAADLAECARLTGRRLASRAQADAALEELVAEATPQGDAELLRQLHRRVRREESILAPVMRELRGARMQQIR